MYPVLGRFLITEMLGGFLLVLLGGTGSTGLEVYYKHAIWLTGVSGIVAVFPCLYWYRKDVLRRRVGGLQKEKRALRVRETVLILLLGAASAFYFSLLVGMFLLPYYGQYQETMQQITNGNSLLWQILWIGIAAPFAEEVVFRWMVYLRMRDYIRYVPAMVFSGLIFGICHGNLVQAVYAWILGIIFAFLLEKTGNLWSCVLAHMGANVFSLIHPEICMALPERGLVIYILVILVVFLGVIFGGIYYFARYRAK